MKNRLAVCLSLAMAAPISYAHHSIAIYNENEAVSLTGNVVEWYRGRPHSYLRREATDELGNENTYLLDFGAFAIDEPYSSAVSAESRFAAEARA